MSSNYDESDDVIDEQSTIYLSDEHEECDDGSIDDRQMDNPVKLSKTQKKNLKKQAKRKKFKGMEECSEYQPPKKKKCSPRM